MMKKMEEDNNLKKWIKQVETRKTEIDKLKVGDRLETTSSIAILHADLCASLHGWAQWLKNPNVMNQLSGEELKETFEIFKKQAKEFLDLDLKMTKSVLNKARKKEKKKSKKTSYVA